MMQSCATKTMKPNNLPDEIRDYLSACGLKQRTIDRSQLETRLYHDLGIYGDIAEGYMEILTDLYQVDLSNFVFDSYFPPEFPQRAGLSGFFIIYIPFVGAWMRRKIVYLPLTLAMIGCAIQAKKWVS
jgi:hypothetical protein